MTGMGDHERRTTPTGRVPRRAMFSAWAVFLSMAGTTMTFQVYHSIHYGKMPWELAVLYGVIPLAISIGVLDFTAEWEDAPGWAKWGAYVITGGSMFLSASATGSVVLHAAPAHLSAVFGLLLDAAALYAIRYILTAPRAARERAARDAARREAAARAEASDLARAQAELARTRADLDGARSARADAQQEAAAARAEAIRTGTAASAAQEVITALRAELDDAGRQIDSMTVARAEAEKRAADARAARAARKAAASAARAQDTQGRAPARAQKSDAAGAEADVDARTKALKILEEEPGISAAQLGVKAGMSKRWGQEHRPELVAMLAAFSEDDGQDAAE